VIYRRKFNAWSRIVFALALVLLAESIAGAQPLQRIVIALQREANKELGAK
jgi:hypothetical protein